MKAMILAAGRGERMRPLTDHTPKPLLKVGGLSLIEHHIHALKRAGVREFVINHAHLGQQIEQTLGTGAAYDVSIRYSPEAQALETAGGILQALPLLGEEAFIVVNGDVWTDYDFSALVKVRPHLAHVVLVNNPEHHPLGDFALNAQGHVNAQDWPRYTFSGIAVYDPAFFKDLAPGKSPLAPLLKSYMQQQQVSGELFQGQWWDIGTPQRLQALDALLQKAGAGT